MSRIMIDPGHAPGNTNHGPTGYFEFAGMWKLSNFLKAALERCGFEVGLTRSENECPELPTRGECAKGCDLFISEHSNAGGGKGCECYYSVRISDDQGFASDLAAAVSGVLGDTSRGAKTWHSTINPAYDYLTVMGSAVYVGCPHVFLCENGFHDNAEDEAKLKSDDKLREIAEAQAKVICNYLGVTYREDVPAQPAPNPAPAPAVSSGFAVGEKVRIRDGVTTFFDGTGMASFVRSALLYVRQIGDGKVLISTQPSGAVTGWVSTGDIVRADGATAPAAPAQPAPAAPAEPAPLRVGDRVCIRYGAEYFANGSHMASFIRNASALYIRQIGDGKVLISTQADGPVTGWVKTGDVVRA